MRIGVVSDTHSLDIPRQLLEDFKNTDFIIHAGDFCAKEDLEILKRVKEVKGVYGNMDGSDIRQVFSRREVFELEGVRIGLFHGEGPVQGLLDLVKDEFKDDAVDIIIFGHAHQPMNETIDNILYFNPGSPSDKVFAPYCSYGILELRDGKIKSEIIKVK